MMRKCLVVLVALISFISASVSFAQDAVTTSNAGTGEEAMKIVSPEFKNNGFIPRQFTCQGDNISPALIIEDIPQTAKSLALIVDDPDAPMVTWVHWLVFDIPRIGRIDENKIPGKQGRNDFGADNYYLLTTNP